MVFIIRDCMNLFEEQPEIPMDLGMALASNPYSMNNFALMTNAQKQAVIEQTRSIESKSEMEAFVRTLSAE